MKTCLFRNGSTPVWISPVLSSVYHADQITYSIIVLIYERFLYQTWKLKSHSESRVFFLPGRLRRYAVTLSFFAKDIPRLSLRFWLSGSGEVEEGLDAIDFFRGSSESKVPTSDDICHASTILNPIAGDEMSQMSYTSGPIGLSLAGGV